MRAAGSLGPVDLVIMRCGWTPRLVQIKSDARGPYQNFRPNDRRELAALALRAGATAWLIHWPPRGEMVWRAAHEWPAA